MTSILRLTWNIYLTHIAAKIYYTCSEEPQKAMLLDHMKDRTILSETTVFTLTPDASGYQI